MLLSAGKCSSKWVTWVWWVCLEALYRGCEKRMSSPAQILGQRSEEKGIVGLMGLCLCLGQMEKPVNW